MIKHNDLLGYPSTSKDRSRWAGILRPYAPSDVLRFRGSMPIEHTWARKGAERLWILLRERPYVAAFGAMTGHQAVEQVRAGLPCIYAGGAQAAGKWQNRRLNVDPEFSSSENVPDLVRSINRSLERADHIYRNDSQTDAYWFAPVVAEACVGFGGTLHVFELMKAMIEAGAAAVHFEDALSPATESGHVGEEMLVTTGEFIERLIAGRLAADVMDVSTVLVASTVANTARLIVSDTDPRDQEFVTQERTPKGAGGFRNGLDAAISRGLAFAPYADILGFETSAPDLKEAQRFATAIHARFPGKLLEYDYSSSFRWTELFDATTVRNFQAAVSSMGYKFQFIAQAGFHSLCSSMFELARGYREGGMAAYVRMQESDAERATNRAYNSLRDERITRAGYFNDIAQTISRGAAPDSKVIEHFAQPRSPKPALDIAALDIECE